MAMESSSWPPAGSSGRPPTDGHRSGNSRPRGALKGVAAGTRPPRDRRGICMAWSRCLRWRCARRCIAVSWVPYGSSAVQTVRSGRRSARIELINRLRRDVADPDPLACYALVRRGWSVGFGPRRVEQSIGRRRRAGRSFSGRGQFRGQNAADECLRVLARVAVG
jgi:hypothetical protein